MMFPHFDMDKTGKLDLNAIKSCLRALGVVQQLVQGVGRLTHCQDKTFLEPKNWAGHNRYNCLIYLFHSIFDFLII